MSLLRGMVPLVASAALGACVDATIGDTPFGPDAGESSGGARDDTTPRPDAEPAPTPDAGGGFGGGGGGSGGAGADAGVDEDADIDGGGDELDAGIDAGVDAEPEPDPDPEPEPFTLTHSQSNQIVRNNSVACVQQDGDGNTTGFLENRYFRVFDLSDPRFDLEGEVVLERADIGVEVANAQEIELNLYSLDDDFRFENLIPVARFTGVDIPAIEDPSILQVTFPPQAMQSDETLVVEFVARDRFFVGSNQEGEHDPSFIKAHDCGIDQPTPFAQVIDRAIHVVMAVQGETVVDDPSFAPTAAGAPIIEVSAAP